MTVPYSGPGISGELNAAATDAAFNDLGMGLLHEYCFPRGVPVVFNGVRRPIESFIALGNVSAASDCDPEGPIETKDVLQFFENAPARIWHVRVNGELIRVTAGHPFYIRGKGFLAAAKLSIGDELRSEDGSRAVVTGVAESKEVEVVYNIRVADFHTYFVGTLEGGVAVLVHNTSPDETGKTKAPSTAGENAYAQEGRVAGAAIEEYDEKMQGSEPQAETKRKSGNSWQPGRQDIGVGGDRKTGAEIGMASRTGVPAKVAQNEAQKKPGNVILVRQQGKPQPAGGSVEAVELNREQAKQLAEEIKKNKSWTSEDIFARAKELAGGKSTKYRVSKPAAAYAGEPTHMRGKKLNTGGSDLPSGKAGPMGR